jgi:iron complex outermembrane receptor protein
MFLPTTVITTLQLNFECFTYGNVNDLYNSITNKVPSVVNGFTYAIRNPKQKVQHHLAKVNYNYYFDETASLAVQYSFQFNKRLEFDVRRGISMRLLL